MTTFQKISLRNIFFSIIFLYAFLISPMRCKKHVAQNQEHFPTTGLVAWWPLNGTALAMSVSGNNGTIYGGVSNTTDRFGKTNSAFLFDGNDGYIGVPTLDSLKYTPITYSAWVVVKSYLPSPFNGLRIRAVIGRLSTSKIDGGVIALHAGKGFNNGMDDNTFGMYRMGGNEGVNTTSKTKPVLNKWTHIVYTQDNIRGSWKWYMDGILTNSGDFTDPQGDFTFFRIGGCNLPHMGWETFWNGKLDDIGVWNRVLTQDEVTYLYNMSDDKI